MHVSHTTSHVGCGDQWAAKQLVKSFERTVQAAAFSCADTPPHVQMCSEALRN